jgi:hypothetical protein
MQILKTEHEGLSGNKKREHAVFDDKVARPGFGPGSPAPKASMLDHYTNGLLDSLPIPTLKG